jgi:hypothetical protein
MARQHRGNAAVAGLAIALVMGSASARAQATQQEAPVTGEVEADPIRCWRRTSTGSVRVGEPFSLVLTCAVIENDTTTVVADQSRLEASAVQLPPFEIIGGERGPDFRKAQRRFFQYQYTLRLISEDSFGADVKIPSTQIGYVVESRVANGETVRGRDQKYDLPEESVRVLSLVPADVADIRDPSYPTFASIDAQRFRARGWYVVGGVFFTAAALVVLVALLQLARRYRRGTDVRATLLSTGGVLRGVNRELTTVGLQVGRDGWTQELAGRAGAAVRVAASLALERRVSQTSAGADVNGHAGQLLVRGGWLRGKKVLVSGAATANALDRELASARGSPPHRLALERLKAALARFTAAQFGREQTLDDAAFSEALVDGRRALEHQRAENRWIVKKYRGMTHFATDLGNRAWSR